MRSKYRRTRTAGEIHAQSGDIPPCLASPCVAGLRQPKFRGCRGGLIGAFLRRAPLLVGLSRSPGQTGPLMRLISEPDPPDQCHMAAKFDEAAGNLCKAKPETRAPRRRQSRLASPRLPRFATRGKPSPSSRYRHFSSSASPSQPSFNSEDFTGHTAVAPTSQEFEQLTSWWHLDRWPRSIKLV